MLTCCYQVSKLRGILFPTQAILATLAGPVLEHLIQKDVPFCSSHANKTSKETLHVPDDYDYKTCINMLPLATPILLTTLVFRWQLPESMQCAAKGQAS